MFRKHVFIPFFARFLLEMLRNNFYKLNLDGHK